MGVGQRAQTVVGVVLDHQRAARLHIGQKGRVGGAQPCAGVEGAHAGHDGIEIGEGGTTLAGGNHVRQRGIADGRHSIVTWRSWQNVGTRPGNVADSASFPFQRKATNCTSALERTV